jgi:hypothetical protein
MNPEACLLLDRLLADPRVIQEARDPAHLQSRLARLYPRMTPAFVEHEGGPHLLLSSLVSDGLLFLVPMYLQVHGFESLGDLSASQDGAASSMIRAVARADHPLGVDVFELFLQLMGPRVADDDRMGLAEALLLTKTPEYALFDLALSHGVSPDKNNNGKPLFVALTDPELDLFAIRLLDAGASPNHAVGSPGREDHFVHLLLARSADALSAARCRSAAGVFRHMLMQGVDLDAKDLRGTTARHKVECGEGPLFDQLRDVFLQWTLFKDAEALPVSDVKARPHRL